MTFLLVSCTFFHSSLRCGDLEFMQKRLLEGFSVLLDPYEGVPIEVLNFALSFYTHIMALETHWSLKEFYTPPLHFYFYLETTRKGYYAAGLHLEFIDIL